MPSASVVVGPVVVVEEEPVAFSSSVPQPAATRARTATSRPLSIFCRFI